MPRKGAGHTGQQSRNPAGRGSPMIGEKVVSTWRVTRALRWGVKGMAEQAGVSQNVFVEFVLGTYGFQAVQAIQALRAAGKGLDGADDGRGADASGPAAAVAGADLVQPEGARSDSAVGSD